jgi:HK97 family phage major capsid protein
MSDNLKEEFSRVHGEIDTVITKAKEEKRDLTEDEQKGVDEKFARLEVIKKLQDKEAKLASLTVDSIQFDNKVKGHGQPVQPKAKEEFGNLSEKEQLDHHVKAVAHFMRTGQMHERYTVVANPNGSNGNNGIALPAGRPVVLKRMSNPFKAALAAYGIPILRTPGYLNIPLIDDTANDAVVIQQNSTAHNIAEPTITNFVPGDVLYDSQASWFANTLLDSLDYDLLGYIRPLLEERVERAQVAAWTTLLTTGGSAAATGVTTTSTTGITFEELVALKYSLPATRSNDMVFVFHRSLMQAIESMVDDNGRPLYVNSLSEEAPDRVMGVPTIVTDALEAPGAGNISGFVASASSLVIREAGPRRLSVYRDYPLKPDQVGLRIFQNGGFAHITGGVKLLAHAAS